MQVFLFAHVELDQECLRISASKSSPTRGISPLSD
jgi:hypothetical protein